MPHLARALAGAYCLIVYACMPACTKQGGQAATDVTVTVADAVCRYETEQPQEPEWVAIACAIEGVAGGVAHLILPRDQANAIMRTQVYHDGGPGK